MELTSAALIKLACLLAGQADPIAVQDFLAQLTPVQIAQIQEVQASGICLPGKFDKKMKRTSSADRAMPTDDI